jgi:hypothetical protein
LGFTVPVSVAPVVETRSADPVWTLGPPFLASAADGTQTVKTTASTTTPAPCDLNPARTVPLRHTDTFHLRCIQPIVEAFTT